jgi:hypothetical protein
MILSSPKTQQPPPWFIATECFDSHYNAYWEEFKKAAKLEQLTELVSLDSMLCPSVLSETKPEYWPHIVDEDYMLNFFTDLSFMLSETSAIERKNVLCVFRNPLNVPEAPECVPAFEFIGFDLLDKDCSTSALTNCGGFPDVFGNEELTRHGLIASLERANEIRTNLRHMHPEEHHADCDVWAIFRLQSTK